MSRCISANGMPRSVFFNDLRRALTGEVDGTVAAAGVVGAFIIAYCVASSITLASRVMRDARGVRGDRVCSNKRMLSDLVVMKSSYLSHNDKAA